MTAGLWIDAVEQVTREVLARLQHLPVAVSPEEFKSHRLAGTFFRTVLGPKLSQLRGFRAAKLELVEAMVLELEWALAYCDHAKARVIKPLRDLLERAPTHCRRFDELHAELQRFEAKEKEDRRRGGLERQAKLECARRRAARLILLLARNGRPRSEAEAARMIEPRLITFVRRRRLAMTCDVNFRRTIVRWIHQHPAVREAYLSARKKKED